jgi:hypothetical protein
MSPWGQLARSRDPRSGVCHTNETDTDTEILRRCITKWQRTQERINGNLVQFHMRTHEANRRVAPR